VAGISDPAYTAPIRMYDGTLDPNYTGGSFAALQSQWTGLGVPQQSDVQSGYDHSSWPQSSMNNGFLFLVGKTYPGTTYTLTVSSGSGSGTYAAGAVVPISANAPPNGMVFDQWTGATVASATSASTTLTMPAANTTVTATYKTAPVNQSPSITSPASAVPSSVTVGTSVTFSVAASDADGDTLSYIWNFGDGASTSTAGATHAYAAAGTFNATVTVSDGRGAAASSTVTVTVTTAGGGSGGGTGGTGGSGSGGSGSGGSGTGGSGTGGSGSGTGAGGTGSAQSPFLMTVSKIQGAVKFSGGHDSCTVSGVIPGLPKLFDPTGQTLTLNLGGAVVSFNLDGKGRGKAAQGTIALKLKSKRNAATKKLEFQGGDAPFAAKLKNGTWAPAWGLDPNSAATGQQHNFAITLQLGATNYAVTVSVSVSSKPNVGAKFKK